MNKTVTTNIGGFIFHIDDIAYEKLSQYLSTIKGYFKQSEGRDEIIGDIEARIAEMFREKTGSIKEVITLKDVDEVIAVMGQPEAFAEEGEATRNAQETAGAASEADYDRKKTRRIFRDPDNKILGGVCSGVGSYFDFDPIWLRLAFAISFFVFGSGFLLYLILWIIIPKAKTTAEKLEMRGERVTVSNIEKTIREEMDELKQRLHNLSGEAKDIGRKDGRVRNAVQDVVDFIGTFFKLLFKAIGKILGAFFLFIGIVLLVAVAASLLGFPSVNHFSNHATDLSMSVNELMLHFINNQQLANWAIVGLALFMCVPLLGLAFAGVKILFNIKTRNKYFGWISGALWTAGLIICLVVGSQVAKDFRVTNIRKDTYTVPKPKTSEVLYLDLTNNFSEQESQSMEVEDWMVFADDDNSQLFRHPDLDIQKSNSDSIELEVRLYARGPSRKDALSRADRINYIYSINDSVISFDKYMSLEQGDKWRCQDAKIILYLPVGQTIFIHRNMKPLIYKSDIDNVTNTWDSDMVNRRWKMTQNGLACVDCDNLRNIDDFDEDEIEMEHNKVPEPGEAPEAPAPPATEQKTHHKTEAAVSDSGVTRQRYELLSKLNRMYLELKYPDTNLVL